MTKPLFLYPDDDADKIIKKLKKGDINGCIVVTKDKRFIGVITQSSLND